MPNPAANNDVQDFTFEDFVSLYHEYSQENDPVRKQAILDRITQQQIANNPALEALLEPDPVPQNQGPR